MEVVVGLFETFAVLGQKRGTYEEWFLSKMLQNVFVIWLSEKNFSYHDVVSVVARNRGDVPPSPENGSDVPTTSFRYYVYVDGEAEWDLGDLYATDEFLENAALKTDFTEVQEVYPSANVTNFFSMMDVVDFASGPVSAAVSGDVSLNDASRRSAEESEFQLKNDLLMAQLSTVTSKSNTWLSFARKRDDNNINFRAFLHASKDKFEPLEGLIAVGQREKQASTHVMQKWVAFRRC